MRYYLSKILYSNSGVITSIFNDKNSGVNRTLRLSVNNTYYDNIIVDGDYFTCKIPDLSTGTYTGYLTDMNDNNYTLNNFTFSVISTTESISVSVDNVTVGNPITVTVTASTPVMAPGTVTVMINNERYDINLTSISATKTISGLKIGNYTLIAYYTGNTYVNPTINTTNFTVSKHDTNLLVSAQNTQTPKNTKKHQKPSKNS